MLPFTPVRHERIAGCTLSVVEYGGTAWVLLSDLARELGVSAARLTGAATNPRTIASMPVIAFTGDKPRSWRLAIARFALPVLAHRLRAGTNNHLLRFAANAQQMAFVVEADLLIRKAHEVKKQRDRLEQQRITQAAQRKAFIEAYDLAKQESVPAAQTKFAATTNLSGGTLSRFFLGTYKTKAAAEAKRHIEQRDNKFSPPPVPKGRHPIITPLTADYIKKRLDEGQSPADVAKIYGLSEATVRHLQEGWYQTAATRAAGLVRQPRG